MGHSETMVAWVTLRLSASDYLQLAKLQRALDPSLSFAVAAADRWKAQVDRWSDEILMRIVDATSTHALWQLNAKMTAKTLESVQYVKTEKNEK